MTFVFVLATFVFTPFMFVSTASVRMEVVEVSTASEALHFLGPVSLLTPNFHPNFPDGSVRGPAVLGRRVAENGRVVWRVVQALDVAALLKTVDGAGRRSDVFRDVVAINIMMSMGILKNI